MTTNAKTYYSDANNAIHIAATEMLRECKRLIERSKEGVLKKVKNSRLSVKLAEQKKKETNRMNKKRKAAELAEMADMASSGGEGDVKRAKSGGRVRAKVERLGMKK